LYELTKCGEGSSDSDIIEGWIGEHLKAGGACLNVFKLLGVHEQGTLIDLIGNGRPISSGDTNNFPVSEVFDDFSCNGWKSVEVGDKVIATAFVGYDFGPIKSCERNVYGIETNVNHMITTIKIQQGPNQRNRATRVRVERSMDGGRWFGVDIIDVFDDDLLHEYSIKASSASRYWRIRPLAFNGGEKDHWHVKKMEMFDYQQTRIDNIQDEFGFMETRDRDYAAESVQMKGYYDLLDTRTELSKFGIDMSNQSFYITVSFRDSVNTLGRPFVIGDIIELPSEIQYKPNMDVVRKYLEVTDVSWSTEGYTPQWRPTLQRLVAEPILASEETYDIIGGYSTVLDETGFLDINTENVQDLTNIAHQAQAAAETKTPEAGSDTFEVAQITDDIVEIYEEQGIDVSKLQRNERALYVEDGLPPNGLPYTEGDTYPTNPKDEDYHRLTYMGMNDNIPPRLFRWSMVKNRWIFCETDRRKQYNKMKPSLQTMLSSDTAKPIDRVVKKDYE
jgi:hypothetical protein